MFMADLSANFTGVDGLVDFTGRRFHIGTIRGVNVIYVMSGQRRVSNLYTTAFFISVLLFLLYCILI